MKIHVITDDKGNIVATVHTRPGAFGDVPLGKPVALVGQKIQELELPKELEGLRDADQLHKRLKEHLR